MGTNRRKRDAQKRSLPKINNEDVSINLTPGPRKHLSSNSIMIFEAEKNITIANSLTQQVYFIKKERKYINFFKELTKFISRHQKKQATEIFKWVHKNSFA